MKTSLLFLVAILFTVFSNLYPQANYIQSIDFDSQHRTVFGLSGDYDSSYACRYKDGMLESWNLTGIFNLYFYLISTTVDDDDNIWAFMQDRVYKFDGVNWSEYLVPNAPLGYRKYSDLSVYNGSLWLTMWSYVLNSENVAYKLDLDSMTWKIYSSSISGHSVGQICHTGDSTWLGTDKGLVMIYNDSLSIELDTTSVPALPSELIYCFYIDGQQNKWLGTYNAGLVKWIDDSNFIEYNTSNSNLPDNFINKIDEDSEGKLWLATDGGLACLENDSITSYAHLTNGYSIVTLAVDEQDRIWMGEMGTGSLLMFDGQNLIYITDVEDERDNSLNTFSLSQNYPNPFNPVTKIKYTIPTPSVSSPLIKGRTEVGLVTLKVFDVLGREITTLVNKEQSVGTYEVEFNAAKLPSGVYFYRLAAGNFTETKKMMLIK